MPHFAQQYEEEDAARRRRSSGFQSRAPIAPSVGVGKKEIRASRSRRIPQAGCQCSGWYAVAERQIFTPTWNLPLGVRNTMFGGLNGYVAGRRISP